MSERLGDTDNGDNMKKTHRLQSFYIPNKPNNANYKITF